MNAIKHVTNTWLVALSIFPFLFLLYDAFSSGETEIGLLIPIAFFGLLFSLPSFLFCLFLFVPVLKTPITPVVKLCLWMLTVSLCILAGVVLICQVFFNIPIAEEEGWVAGCAIIAALLSILLRVKQFLLLVTIQNKDYENELV